MWGWWFTVVFLASSGVAFIADAYNEARRGNGFGAEVFGAGCFLGVAGVAAAHLVGAI